MLFCDPEGASPLLGSACPRYCELVGTHSEACAACAIVPIPNDRTSRNALTKANQRYIWRAPNTLDAARKPNQRDTQKKVAAARAVNLRKQRSSRPRGRGASCPAVGGSTASAKALPATSRKLSLDVPPRCFCGARGEQTTTYPMARDLSKRQMEPSPV